MRPGMRYGMPSDTPRKAARDDNQPILRLAGRHAPVYHWPYYFGLFHNQNSLGYTLMVAGIMFFSLAVLFQLVALSSSMPAAGPSHA